MNWWKDRRVGTKLLAAFGALLALGLLFGVVAIKQLSAIRRETDDCVRVAMVDLVAAGKLQADFVEQRRYFQFEIVATSPAERSDAQRRIAAGTADVTREIAELSTRLATHSTSALIQNIERTRPDYPRAPDEATRAAPEVGQPPEDLAAPTPATAAARP